MKRLGLQNIGNIEQLRVVSQNQFATSTGEKYLRMASLCCVYDMPFQIKIAVTAYSVSDIILMLRKLQNRKSQCLCGQHCMQYYVYTSHNIPTLRHYTSIHIEQSEVKLWSMCYIHYNTTAKTYCTNQHCMQWNFVKTSFRGSEKFALKIWSSSYQDIMMLHDRTTANQQG